MIKNSCNGKGCSIRIINLPNDGRVVTVLSKMHGYGNAIPEILPMVNLSLGKKPQKEKEVEKKNLITSRSLCIL